VFFEDDEPLTPGQVKKYGYRLIKGIGNRLISLAELKEMIAELALEIFLQRNLYVQRVLRDNSVTLWWDEKFRSPRFKITPNQKQDAG
jgi:hypothetical protein